MAKTTTIKVEDNLVDALSEAGKRLGGIGWTRMLIIVATEWADKQAKAKEKVS